MNNFLKTNDFSRAELEEIIESALKIKSGEIADKPLAGKSVGLVFFNPSLRTRASMQVGIYELGGNAVILEPGGTSWTLEHRTGAVMDGNKTEHLAEFTFANLQNWEAERLEPILSAFEKYASKPVINLESAMHHPCQSMADMMTIREKFGKRKKKVLLTWAWHPKPLPMAVPNSFALAAAQFGHDLRIAHPKGYELDGELLTEIESQAKENGGSLEIVNNAHSAFDETEVVYAKSWGSFQHYGNANQDIREREVYRTKWIVDDAKMARSNDAIFMHCLPVRRNVIVTDSVIDSPRSVVIDEAENRLHVQKAIMSKLLRS